MQTVQHGQQPGDHENDGRQPQSIQGNEAKREVNVGADVAVGRGEERGSAERTGQATREPGRINRIVTVRVIVVKQRERRGPGPRLQNRFKPPPLC
jgi:hypothetical protein